MARNVKPLGQCGIASMAQFPIVPQGSPLPVPPRTQNDTRPKLPCNCELSCTQTCKAIGMSCCDGTGGNCNCAPASSCPKCQQHVLPYGRCVSSCAPNAVDAGCVSTAGLPGNICSPKCKSPCKWATGNASCPPVPNMPGTTATAMCDYCFGANSSTDTPHACALICDASTSKAPFARDGCLPGQTCKPMNLNGYDIKKDPCECAHITLPCASKTPFSCGFCTFDV
jgi:hypothetical protein